MANEAIEEYRSKNKEGVLLKLDFEKVNVKYSILINGSSKGSIQASKSLRHGDPMSPILHGCLSSNCEDVEGNTIEPIKIGRNEVFWLAKYRVISLEICEEIWLQKVLSDLHQECETPLKLFCDSKAAISIANNPVQHDRTKHVKIDRHFIKERLDNGSICISYIPSSQQVADVLTKGLLRPNFDFRVSKLGLPYIYVPT
ncbi:putative mitochondrial protein [Cucumis melo var. makuwa]|uniref:Putative mitochondrial protein n=1 Tax=Cucumis melo var. makuwa TaxID=1194695 RepID=A0A5D3C8K2_CUCMM|nr:putative mitochondrial protein [Cucumis melo var. makuwa]